MLNNNRNALKIITKQQTIEKVSEIDKLANYVCFQVDSINLSGWHFYSR